MKKICVTIEETISQEFEIEVSEESKRPLEEALLLAEVMYNKGEIVVDNGNLISKSMMANNKENSIKTEWREF